MTMPILLKLDEQAQKLWCDVYARVLVSLPDYGPNEAADAARLRADLATNAFFEMFDPSDDDGADEPNDLEDGDE